MSYERSPLRIMSGTRGYELNILIVGSNTNAGLGNASNPIRGVSESISNLVKKRQESSSKEPHLRN